MSAQLAPDGIGTTESQSDRTIKSDCLTRILLIPCIALSAVTLHQQEGLAQSFFGRCIQERIQERRLQESKLTDSQKQQLFDARRDWTISSYDQRLALLKSGQDCLQSAQTFKEGEECRSKQRQAGRQLLEQGRQVMNAERQRLGLSPLRSVLPFGF